MKDKPRKRRARIGRNKSRLGCRGKKMRYSVFRAEQNRKWSPFEEAWARAACEKHGLDVESFFDPEDKPNRKWWHVWRRVRKATKEI